MTGPSPCGNNCAPFSVANASGACPVSCQCPIDVTTPLTTSPLTLATAEEPFLQLNVQLSSSTASCAAALSPGLLTLPNGLSACPGSHNANGTACKTATQYTACDQDYHCDLVTTSPTFQTCIYNLNSVWIDPNCIVGADLGFDLTIEPGCTNSGGTNVSIPVCNRGGATIPAGQVIVITSSPFGASCQAKACGGPATADCSFTLTSALTAGSCVNVPPSAGCNLGAGDTCLEVNPGNTVKDVNGNKECNTTASGATWPGNGTGAGCQNNDTYVKNTPAGCETCSAPLSSGVPSLTSWNVTYSCVPSE
jgi:hypothetical protein